MNEFDQYLIDVSATIREAFKKMCKMNNKFILVSRDGKIIGIVTDGDFRRAIWEAVPFDSSIKAISNLSFVFFGPDYTSKDIRDTFTAKNIMQIPIIRDGVLLKVLTKDEIEDKEQDISNEKLDAPVVIMAGGKGTRLDPFTRILPKPLIPIGNDPIIGIIMKEFSKIGMRKFYLTLNDKSKMIQAYFHDHSLDYDINFINEEKPLGTAGSLKLINFKNVSSLVVTNCDIIIKDDYYKIFKYHAENKNDITLVGSLQHFKIPYGVCKIENGGRLKSIMEKPEYDYLSNTGFYVLTKNILKLIPKNKYFDMTDLINRAIKENFKVGVYPVSDRSWLDIGQWEEYKKALNALT